MPTCLGNAVLTVVHSRDDPQERFKKWRGAATLSIPFRVRFRCLFVVVVWLVLTPRCPPVLCYEWTAQETSPALNAAAAPWSRARSHRRSLSGPRTAHLRSASHPRQPATLGAALLDWTPSPASSTEDNAPSLSNSISATRNACDAVLSASNAVGVIWRRVEIGRAQRTRSDRCSQRQSDSTGEASS